ncbi:MAG: DUF2970 domain-containing protein [Gammaproteobacteria bacterium]|nr:DUF2970 domain-containing protein [Gammaproteobacteria bacterium]
MENENSKDPNALQILWSMLASFVGVQNKRNFERDNAYIEKKGIKPYIFMGIFLVIVFHLTIFTIVKLVIP